jgi:hypothetical protein
MKTTFNQAMSLVTKLHDKAYPNDYHKAVPPYGNAFSRAIHVADKISGGVPVDGRFKEWAATYIPR